MMIDFKELRFDDNFHLGLGDIRLTMSQQEEVEKRIAALEEDRKRLEYLVGKRYSVVRTATGHYLLESQRGIFGGEPHKKWRDAIDEERKKSREMSDV